jgi:hypothetical protein
MAELRLAAAAAEEGNSFEPLPGCLSTSMLALLCEHMQLDWQQLAPALGRDAATLSSRSIRDPFR